MSRKRVKQSYNKVKVIPILIVADLKYSSDTNSNAAISDINENHKITSNGMKILTIEY